jgi:thioredoxin-dependent peroxiredoxin
MTAPLTTGQRAPEVRLQDQDGREVSLEDLRGPSGLVVYFFPKAFTPGCTTEACDFRDHHEGLESRGYRVVGISGDEPGTLRDFAAEHRLPFTLLSDPDSATARAWGAWGEREIKGARSIGPLRSTVVLDADGVVESVQHRVEVPAHVTSLLDLVTAGGAR